MEKRTLNVYLIYLSVCLFVCCIRLSVCAFVVLGWVYQSWEGAGPNCTLPPPPPLHEEGGGLKPHTLTPPLSVLFQHSLYIYFYFYCLWFSSENQKNETKISSWFLKVPSEKRLPKIRLLFEYTERL